jgi:hypothetical protein
MGMWRKLFLILFLALLFGGCATSRVLEKKFVFNLKVSQIKKGNEEYLLVSGLCGHSACGVKEIIQKCVGDKIIVIVEVAPGGNGNFETQVKLDKNISEVLFGEDKSVIWKRPKDSVSSLSTLENALKEIFKEKDIKVKIISQKDGLTVKYHIKPYISQVLLAEKYPFGNDLKEGPDKDGFILNVFWNKGKYMGAAIVPGTIRNSHWKTFVNSYPTSGHNPIYLALSYGEETNKDLLEKILKAVGNSAKNMN